MNDTRSACLAAALLLSALSAGCGNKSDPGAASTATAAPTGAVPMKPAATATAAAATAGGTKDVALTPLPLKVVMPASEAAPIMDKSRDGTKSVAVSYDEVQSGLNVSEPREKTFADVKKRVKSDAIYPFKRWVQESATSGIEEFSYSGKTGYVAWMWKEVGGKPYVCQSTGMSGVATPEKAQKVLKICETLAAK